MLHEAQDVENAASPAVAVHERVNRLELIVEHSHSGEHFPFSSAYREPCVHHVGTSHTSWRRNRVFIDMSGALKALAEIGVPDEEKVGCDKIFMHRKYMDLLGADGHTIEPYPAIQRAK